MKISKILVLFLTVITMSCGDVSQEEMIEKRTSKMTEMAELGTTEYTISKIIKADDNKAFYTIGDRKILMSCKAVVKAGIDLKDFSEEDVRYSKESNSVTVMLPKPKVLSLNIPAEKVKMEYMKVGMLRSDFSADERNRLLSQGEEDIRSKINTMGILEDARKNAVMFVESLYRSTGVDKVFVEFVDKED